MKTLIFLLLLSLQLNATTYYVKVGGGTGSGLDDANAWSYAKLKATALSAGDIVLFKAGEVFTSPDGSHLQIYSGTSGNHTTYGRYGSGANPILNGFTTLSSWTLSSGNIYYTTLDVPILHGVTLDGVAKGMGRYPNTGYLQYTSHNLKLSITGASIAALPFNAVGAEVVIRKVRWALDRHFVTDHTGSTLTFNSTNFYGSNSLYSPVDNNGYFIQGHLSALDLEGEWWYDNDNNRLYMHFGSGTPSGRTVKASTQNLLINTNGDYFTFNDLDFEGGNTAISATNAGNIIINNCNFRQQAGTAFYSYTCNDITMNGGSINGALNNGFNIAYGGTNVTVKGVTISNIGTIAGAGANGSASHLGIFVDGTGILIRRNSVSNTGYSAIQFNGSDALVDSNFVDTYCTKKDDGGGIYTVNSVGAAVTNRIIRANIVLNAVGAYVGAEAYWYEAYGKAAGIYLDDLSTQTTVENNVVLNGDWAGIFSHHSNNNTFTGNLVYNHNQQQFYLIQYTAGTAYGQTVTGNQFIAKEASQRAMQIRLETADNPANLGVFNNNIYARPVDDDDVIYLYRFHSGTNEFLTLAQWKANYGEDAASTSSAVITGSSANFKVDYNATSAAADVALSGPYMSMAGVNYSSTVPLAAYSGSVLLPYVVPPWKVYRSGGKIVVKAGKIVKQ